MSEVSNAATALAQWPGWQAIFLVVVVAAGWFFRWLGMRDRKAGFGGATEMPMYLLAHDVVGHITSLLAETKITNEKIFRVVDIAADNSKALRDVAEATRAQTQILEDIRNQLEVRPPPARVR